VIRELVLIFNPEICLLFAKRCLQQPKVVFRVSPRVVPKNHSISYVLLDLIPHSATRKQTAVAGHMILENSTMSNGRRKRAL